MTQGIPLRLTREADRRDLVSSELLKLFGRPYEGAVVVDRAGCNTWIRDRYKASVGWYESVVE